MTLYGSRLIACNGIFYNDLSAQIYTSTYASKTATTRFDVGFTLPLINVSVEASFLPYLASDQPPSSVFNKSNLTVVYAYSYYVVNKELGLDVSYENRYVSINK